MASYQCWTRGRGIHLLLRETLAAHRQHKLLAERFRLRKREELLLAHSGKARQEGQVERRHAHRRGWHFVDEAHERAHSCAHDRIAGGESFGRRHDFVEIFDDDRGIDHDRAVVVERRHHAVRVKCQVVRLELVAGQQVELDLREGNLFCIEHEAHALAAGRLRRVVESKGHGTTYFMTVFSGPHQRIWRRALSAQAQGHVRRYTLGWRLVERADHTGAPGHWTLGFDEWRTAD